MERGELDKSWISAADEPCVKGLEFPYVYLVVGMEELLPPQAATDEDNVDEERRLAYAASPVRIERADLQTL